MTKLERDRKLFWFGAMCGTGAATLTGLVALLGKPVGLYALGAGMLFVLGFSFLLLSLIEICQVANRYNKR